MSILIKSFALHFVLFGVLDAIWWGYIANKFFIDEMGHIAKMVEGKPNLNLYAGLVVYVVMSMMLSVFVVKNPMTDSAYKAALFGALIGVGLFATYEFTNLSIIADYPIKFALVDTAWGTFMCSLLGLASYKFFLENH